MKYPKIAIIADALDNQKAGVHVYLRGLLHGLYQVQPEANILIIRAHAGNEFPQWEQKVIASPNNLIDRAKRVFIDLPIAIKKWGAQIAFDPAHFGPFYLPDTIRRVTFIHDLTPLLFPQYHPRHSALLQRLFLPRIVKNASLLLCNSKHTKKDIVEFWPEAGAKTSILYPGLDPFWTNDHSYQSNQNPYDKPFILAVGTLEPRKNLGTLIKAFEKLKANGWPGQLVLTGAKGWKPKLWSSFLEESTVREDIILTGFVSKAELKKRYLQCSVFVYPSKYEGFGLPVIEALASGAKVVCSSSSSLPEAGGTLVTYFRPDSVLDLYAKLETSLHQEKPFTQAELETHLQQFSWTRSAEKFLSLMRELMSQ